MEIITINGMKGTVRELTYEEVLMHTGKKAFIYIIKDKFWPEGYYPAYIEKPSYATGNFDETVGKVTYRNKDLIGWANIWPGKEHTQIFIKVEEGV